MQGTCGHVIAATETYDTTRREPRSLARRVGIVSRFAAAILGGYVFTYGFTALATLVGFAAGLPLSDAQVLAWLLAGFVYLGAILWGFVPRHAWQAWLVLAGGGAAMSAATAVASGWVG